MNARAIIHINVADFAVAVERALDSRLRDRPVIVAPGAAVRAAVYDMSDEAYRRGVRKGMALRRAMRRCPDAAVIPPHTERYEQAMTRLIRHALPYSPLVEMNDCAGHLFIDATGTSRLFGPAPDVAWKIRKAVRSDMGIDPIWSVAPNKLVAKVATRLVKPSGEYIVAAGDEKAVLRPLSVSLVPGVEAPDVFRLREYQLMEAGQVAHLSMAQLEVLFGRRSQALYEAVRGIDTSPVLPAGQADPSIRRAHDFGTDTNAVPAVEAALYRLAESIGMAVRSRGMAAGRVGLAIQYSDGGRCRRHEGIRPASATDRRLFEAARIALHRAWHRRIRIRQIVLLADRLTFPPAQLSLFDEERRQTDSDERLTRAVDAVRKRFGNGALQLGRTLQVNSQCSIRNSQYSTREVA